MVEHNVAIVVVVGSTPITRSRMRFKPRELLYPANLLTLSRLLLVAPLLYFLSLEASWGRWATLGVAVAMTLTDLLDGFVSRRRNEVTELGKAMDPTVDKIVGVAAVIGLCLFRDFPLWYVIFKAVKEGVNKDEAATMKQKLEAAGATAEIK